MNDVICILIRISVLTYRITVMYLKVKTEMMFTVLKYYTTTDYVIIKVLVHLKSISPA